MSTQDWSRAGGHLVTFVRFARHDRPPLAVCSCGFEVRAETDDGLAAAFKTHRSGELNAGRTEAMERVKTAGGRGFALQLAGSRPPKPAPADVVTSHERAHGWDGGPAAAPLDPHRLAWHGVGGVKL